MNFVLQTLPLGRQHTAEDMANLMKEIALDWSLSDILLLPYNASNMVNVFKAFWKWSYFGCIGHISNFSAKKVLGCLLF